MIKQCLLLLLITSPAYSARITLNNAGSVGVTSSTIFNDNKVKVTLSTPRECCIGNSCSQYTQILLDNPTSKELKVALDGYEYEVNSNIQLIHSVNLFSIADTPMRSCMKATGGFPAIGTGQTNISASNFYLGISNAYLDVKNWRLMLRSIDGNVVCQNGTLISPETPPGGDVIFYDGFDNIIFKNGFE